MSGKYQHYTVEIYVIERASGEGFTDKQNVAAESISQAIRRAGMRAVQRLKKRDQ